MADAKRLLCCAEFVVVGNDLGEGAAFLLLFCGLKSDRLDPEGQHLDLYGGVGLLGAALGDLVGPRAKLTSVESSERATDRRDGASASLASSVSRSNRSHTALRRTCPRISSTETSPSPFRLLGGLT